MHNHIVAWEPVYWSCDLVLVSSLERIDDAQNLGGVPTSAGGVGENSTDLLVRVDNEDATDCEGDAFLVDVGGILVVDPADNLD